MRAIWKFPIDVTDTQHVSMPSGATIRYLAMQGDAPCLWVEVYPEAEPELRTICIYGTGHPITHFSGNYLGSFQMRGGALVFHAYEALT
jgi:hypothetical protein